LKNTEKNHKPILDDPRGWFHRIFINEAILSLLLVLCFIGVAYTNALPLKSYHYWLWIIPVFAIAAIISEWSRYKRHEIDGYHFIRQQILHWGAVLIAVKSIFMLYHIGRYNTDTTALTLMIIMALSTILAGIYIGWRFIVLGLFISFATLVFGYMEAYVWILVPVAVGIIIFAIGIALWEYRKLKN